MKEKIYLLVALFLVPVIFRGQDIIIPFSQAIDINIKSYIKNCNQAYSENNPQKAIQLFDTLVHTKLLGTRFDEFEIQNSNSKKITLSKIDKPVFIISYASWCVMNNGDIPAINKLATAYGDDLQILIFFWGSDEDLSKTHRLFHKKVQICWVENDTDKNYKLIHMLKNSLGFPMAYFVASDKTVCGINRISNPNMFGVSLENAVETSYTKFNKMISEGIVKNNLSSLNYVKN